jgi:hypothetical protein
VIPLLAATALADLLVNQDLGTLFAGTIRLSGDTTGYPNNADKYDGLGMPTYTENGPEYVYQFTLTSTMQLSIPTQYQSGAPDNDQFILNRRTTVFDGVYNRAVGGVGFVDETGSFRAYGPGTYYLSVDGYNGAAGAYDFDFMAVDYSATPPSVQADLGAIDDIGSDPDVVVSGNLPASTIRWYKFSVSDIWDPGYLQIDTEGTMLTPSNDTEIALYDEVGNFLVTDDDGGSGLLSMMRFGAGQNHGAFLGAGTYYLAVGGFNSTFANAFNATSTSGNTGTYYVNFSANYYVYGDLDGDGDVDLSDLAQLLAHYGTPEGATYQDGDLDGDGDVDLSDLAALLGVYGTTCE